MKVIILAAGRGSRLGKSHPKSLTPLYKEKSILDFQLEKITKITSPHDILIVVGYKKEEVMQHYPSLTYVYNSSYTRTNTAKSLLLALKDIEEDVLFLNGDVYFDDGVIELLIRSEYSACLVNMNKCSEEEIKYTTNKKGFIHELSKQVANAKGEAVGINLLKKDDIKKVTKELETVNDSDYFEKALENLTLAKKLLIRPIDISEFYCREIDFPEDLVAVQRYLITKLK